MTTDNVKGVETPKPPVQRRLNFILSDDSYQDLQDLASQSQRTMTDLIRYGLGMMRIFVEAKRQRHRVMIVDDQGKAVKEIVLPL